MASVRVRIEDFEDGVLPGVCASSGAPADRFYRAEISSRSSGWLWLFLFAGPMGFIAAIAIGGLLRKTAHGLIPYADDVQARLRRTIRRCAWGVAASIACLVGGFALLQTDGFRSLGVVAILGSVAGLVVASFLWANPPGSVGGHLDSTGRWVELDPVSAGFAGAYARQDAARRAARRDAVTDIDRQLR